MSNNFTAVVETFWIAHGEDDLVHGALAPQEQVSSGLPHLETYTDPRECGARLVLLRHNYSAALAEWLEIKRLREPSAHLADYRWKKETGGIVLSSGARVETTREAQSQIATTMTILALGLVAEPIPWKAQTGWMLLTGAELMAVAGEVALHVGRCFKAEQIVTGKIGADPDFDVEAAFDAAYGALQ